MTYKKLKQLDNLLGEYISEMQNKPDEVMASRVVGLIRRWVAEDRDNAEPEHM